VLYELFSSQVALDDRIVQVRHGRVQLIGAGDLVQEWTEDQRRVNGSDIELQLLRVLVPKFPERMLSLCLAGEVLVVWERVFAVSNGIGVRLLVPVLLRVYDVLLCDHLHDRDGRGGDDNTLDFVPVLERTVQNGGGSANGWLDEFAGLNNIKVEGGCCVSDDVHVLDGFIECAILSQ
jgi:hypothetical protein